MNLSIQQFRTAPKNRSSSDPAAQPLNDPVEESAPVASAADPQPHSDENVSVPCGVCNKEVPYRDWETHLAEEHQQLMCPICCQTFPKNVSGMDSSFHVHVEYHFDPVRYPTTS